MKQDISELVGVAKTRVRQWCARYHLQINDEPPMPSKSSGCP